MNPISPDPKISLKQAIDARYALAVVTDKGRFVRSVVPESTHDRGKVVRVRQLSYQLTTSGGTGLRMEFNVKDGSQHLGRMGSTGSAKLVVMTEDHLKAMVEFSERLEIHRTFKQVKDKLVNKLNAIDRRMMSGETPDAMLMKFHELMNAMVEFDKSTVLWGRD